MAKMMPPGETIWWVPIEHAPDEASLLKPALYTGQQAKAVNISCAIAAGYTLGAAESDTDDTRSICDVGNVKTPTIGNYEGNLTFFREKLAEGNKPRAGSDPKATDADKAWELFKKGLADPAEGYLVKRIGMARDVAAAQGQEISAFKFIADNPTDVTGDGTAPIQFSVPFMPQGHFFLNKPLAGA